MGGRLLADDDVDEESVVLDPKGPLAD